MSNKAEDKHYLQDLFEHMSNEHGLTLLESEMHDIIDVCLKQTDYNNLATECNLLRKALRELVKDIEMGKTLIVEHGIRIYEAIITPSVLDEAKQILTNTKYDEKGI